MGDAKRARAVARISSSSPSSFGSSSGEIVRAAINVDSSSLRKMLTSQVHGQFTDTCSQLVVTQTLMPALWVDILKLLWTLRLRLPDFDNRFRSG